MLSANNLPSENSNLDSLFFQSLFEHSPYAIVVHDAQNLVFLVNPAFENLFGYSCQDIRMKPLRHLIVPSDLLTEYEQEMENLGPGKLVHRPSQRLTKDGRRLDVFISSFAVWRDKDKLGSITIYQDMSDQRKAEEQYRSIFENAVEGIFQSTPDGKYLKVNSALAEMYGFSSPSQMLEYFTNISHQLYVQPGRRQEFERQIKSLGRLSHFESQVYKRDGDVIWISEHARPVFDANGDILFYEGTVENVTKRKQAEHKLLKSEQEYRTIFETTGNASVIIEYNQDVALINKEFTSLTGYSVQDVERGLKSITFIAPEDRQRIREFHFLRRRNPDMVPRKFELRILTKQGEIKDVMATVAMLPGSGRSIASMLDISDRKKTEHLLQYQAFHDPLTGLPNRLLLMDRIGQALEHAKRTNEKFALLFLDLDRFKVVNDSLGHGVGDELLNAITSKILSCLRSMDTLARLGGDEFVILLEDFSRESDVIRIVERMKKELQDPFDISGHCIHTTVSIGIVFYCSRYERAEHMLRDADTAMYQAKSLGKDRYIIFNTSMHDNALSLLKIENELRQAVLNKDFEVHYQPIVDTKTCNVSGFEALVRWKHPEEGLIYPDKFIPIAEETGLIIDIDRIVLEEACQKMHNWTMHSPYLPPLELHVNMSGPHFKCHDLLSTLDNIFLKTAFDPNYLHLEITESVLMDLFSVADDLFINLQKRGIRLSIDDFGTGYSSLSYLHRIPAHTLKIDRSFVMHMEQEQENAEIIKTIVTLAHNLNMQVIAEGVENRSSFSYLQGLGCENCQGFFLSRPIPSMLARNFIYSRKIEQVCGD